MRKYIPNALTLLNLLSGCIATLLAINDNLIGAALFVFIGVFFDFFDGFFARKFNLSSELGVQLDSLADMVTSGLVPGLVMFQLMEYSSNEWLENSEIIAGCFGYCFNTLSLSAFLITLASAYRLAKFNISKDQKDNFIGLPTPANTLLILSLPLILEFQSNDWVNSIIINKWFLLVFTLLSCYLLNAPVKLLALKFKNFSLKENKEKYLLIILSIALLVTLKFIAIPLIIALYILISLITRQ